LGKQHVPAGHIAPGSQQSSSAMQPLMPASIQQRLPSQLAWALQQSPGLEQGPLSFGKQHVPAGHVAPGRSQQSSAATHPLMPASIQQRLPSQLAWALQQSA
jgi:hypothetical protein